MIARAKRPRLRFEFALAIYADRSIVCHSHTSLTTSIIVAHIR